MSTTRIILVVSIWAIAGVLVVIKTLDMRQSYIDHTYRLADMSVAAYTKYYEKWEEKRLEGAETFLRIAHEPDSALIYIDSLIGLCVLFFLITVVQCAYYEYRHAKLLNKRL